MFFSGRELFLSDSSLFVDDVDAEAYEKYQREESKVAAQKVNPPFFPPPQPYRMLKDGKVWIFVVSEVLHYCFVLGNLYFTVSFFGSNILWLTESNNV